MSASKTNTLWSGVDDQPPHAALARWENEGGATIHSPDRQEVRVCRAEPRPGAAQVRLAQQLPIAATRNASPPFSLATRIRRNVMSYAAVPAAIVQNYAARPRTDDIGSKTTYDLALASKNTMDLEVDEEAFDDVDFINFDSETAERTFDDGPDGYYNEFD